MGNSQPPPPFDPARLWAFRETDPFFKIPVHADLIAGGAMGAVYKATLRDEVVAAKTHHALRNPDLYGLSDPVALKTVLDEVERELEALSRLGDHPRVVGFRGAAFDANRRPTYVCMELATGGTLHDVIHAAERPSQAHLVRLAVEVAEGVAFIHNREMAHRDLKPKNIFIGKDGKIKIGDLGLAKVIVGLTSHTAVGTPAYRPPNLEDPIPSDIYALGVILVELVLGEEPRMGDALEAQVARAAARLPLMEDVVRGCLRPPRERMTAIAALRGLIRAFPQYVGRRYGGVPWTPQTLAAPGSTKPIGVAVTVNWNIVVAATEPRCLHVLHPGKGVLKTINLPWRSYGVAVDDHNRNFIVTNREHNQVAVLSEDGIELFSFGSPGDRLGEFNQPGGCAVDTKGNIFVADFYNNRLQEFSNTGRPLRIIGAAGKGPGQFNGPSCVAVNSDGLIAVGEMSNKRVQLLRPDGSHLRFLGHEDGAGKLYWPSSVAFDRAGNIIVADAGNPMKEMEGHDRVVVFRPDGRLLWQFGSRGSGPGQFRGPWAVAAHPDGWIIVADSLNDRIQFV